MSLNLIVANMHMYIVQSGVGKNVGSSSFDCFKRLDCKYRKPSMYIVVAGTNPSGLRYVNTDSYNMYIWTFISTKISL